MCDDWESVTAGGFPASMLVEGRAGQHYQPEGAIERVAGRTAALPSTQTPTPTLSDLQGGLAQSDLLGGDGSQVHF